MSAIMSFGVKKSTSLPPEEILAILLKGDFLIDADQLAQMLTDQDSGIQIADVRNPDKYKSQSIPGALNIPIANLLEPGNSSIIGSENLKTIFYSDDEMLSTQAWMLSMQKGYTSVYILRGGLAEWDSIVMISAFSGEKITAQENALFEKRYKARRLFTRWNAMPDSLKAGFFVTKKKKDRELVGGCE
jgi:rhodanese-related sulfurtransferase